MYEIQTNKKKENDALRENEVLIAAKDNQASQQRIDLDLSLDNKTVDAEKQRIEFAKNKQIAIAKATAEQERESQTALIKKDIAILEQEGLKLTQQEALAKKQQGVNEAETNAETVRLKAIKEREKQIAILDAEQNAEAGVIKTQKEAEANFFKVEQEAKAMERLAEAKRKNYEVEAAGIELKNNAENKLSKEMIEYNQKMKLIETFPAIIREMVAPMKTISDVKIISVNGLGGNSNCNSVNDSTQTNNSNSFVRDFYDASLKNKVDLGLIKHVTREAGLDLDISSITDITPSISMNGDK
jgi:hypothetical protein